jgi:hypothetical protein
MQSGLRLALLVAIATAGRIAVGLGLFAVVWMVLG